MLKVYTMTHKAAQEFPVLKTKELEKFSEMFNHLA